MHLVSMHELKLTSAELAVAFLSSSVIEDCRLNNFLVRGRDPLMVFILVTIVVETLTPTLWNASRCSWNLTDKKNAPYLKLDIEVVTKFLRNANLKIASENTLVNMVRIS